MRAKSQKPTRQRISVALGLCGYCGRAVIVEPAALALPHWNVDAGWWCLGIDKPTMETIGQASGEWLMSAPALRCVVSSR